MAPKRMMENYIRKIILKRRGFEAELWRAALVEKLRGG